MKNIENKWHITQKYEQKSIENEEFNQEKIPTRVKRFDKYHFLLKYNFWLV